MTRDSIPLQGKYFSLLNSIITGFDPPPLILLTSGVACAISTGRGEWVRQFYRPHAPCRAKNINN